MGKHGGARKGAGRKPKNDEQALLDKLSVYSDEAHSKLREAVENGDQWAIKMFFEYFYGRPNQNINHQNDGGKFDNARNDLTKEQIDKLIDKL